MLEENIKHVKIKTLDQEQISYNLTDEMILKIEKTISTLSRKSVNPQAITLAHNLKTSKDISEKRKWIVLFYINCFQLLSFIQMGQKDQRTFEDYEIELKRLFKEI